MIDQLVRDPLWIEGTVRSTKKVKELHRASFDIGGSGRVMEAVSFSCFAKSVWIMSCGL
jgi:hypothetical protein